MQASVVLLLVGTAASMTVPLTLVTLPPPIPFEPVPTSSPTSCDIRYCDGTTSWCHYWAGVTTYDPTLGPLPGETRKPLGTCGKALSSATYTPIPAPVPAPTFEMRND